MRESFVSKFWLKDLDLVVDEVLLGAPRSLLEDDDAEAGGRELLGDHAAGRARSDDDEVHLVVGPVLHRATAAAARAADGRDQASRSYQPKGAGPGEAIVEADALSSRACRSCRRTPDWRACRRSSLPRSALKNGSLSFSIARRAPRFAVRCWQLGKRLGAALHLGRARSQFLRALSQTSARWSLAKVSSDLSMK